MKRYISLISVVVAFLGIWMVMGAPAHADTQVGQLDITVMPEKISAAVGSPRYHRPKAGQLGRPGRLDPQLDPVQ